MLVSERQMSGAALPGTECRALESCPEIRLHLKPPSQPLDAFRDAHAASLGGTLPYWAVAWPGGQALARYVLDQPETVRDRHVVDLGAGSGLAAIAATKAGAKSVTALDRDPFAIQAIALNALENNVLVTARLGDFETFEITDADVILAGDLWYERFDAARATRVLRGAAEAGCLVLAGDLGRAFLPRRDIDLLARSEIAVDAGIEGRTTATVSVVRLQPHAATA